MFREEYIRCALKNSRRKTKHAFQINIKLEKARQKINRRQRSSVARLVYTRMCSKTS